MITSKLQHVTAKDPCPICEKPDWCSVSGNGELVICMRVSDGAHKTSKNGGWVHLQVDPNRPKNSYIAPIKIVAPAARRDAVYKALLDRLPLDSRHWKHLQNVRLLSEETSTRCQFATVPTREEGDRIAADLGLEFNLTNVPGFFWKENKPRLRFAGYSGFYIPIRDHIGQVSALQIRR